MLSPQGSCLYFRALLEFILHVLMFKCTILVPVSLRPPILRGPVCCNRPEETLLIVLLHQLCRCFYNRDRAGRKLQHNLEEVMSAHLKAQFLNVGCVLSCMDSMF